MVSLDLCTVCSESGAWVCNGCGAKCAAHVRRLSGSLLRYRCAACGEGARLRRIRRGDLQPFQAELLPLLKAPLKGRLVLAWILLAVASWLSAPLGLLGVLLASCVGAILSVQIIRTSADGEPFDWPSPTRASEELLQPLARVFAATAPLFVLWFALVHQAVVVPWRVEAVHTHTLERVLVTSPWLWLCAAATALLLPGALLSAVLAPGTGAALHPAAGVRHAWRVRRDWGWVLAVSAGSVLLTLLVAVLLPQGHAGAFVAALVASYGGLVLARVIGALLYLNVDVFDWGSADEGLVDLADPYAPEVLEEKPRAAQEPAPAASLEARLTAALQARDVPLMLRTFRDHQAEALTLPPELLLRAGQAAASATDYALALDALTAAARENSDVGARALVIAARILDERLRDDAGAKTLYEQVLVRFPQGPAADYARRQLAEPRFLISRRTG